MFYRFLLILLLAIPTMVIPSKAITAADLSSLQSQPSFADKLPLSEYEALQNTPKINYVYDPDWPPFEWQNAQGEHVGIVADIVKLLEKKTGIEFQPIATQSWQESIDTVKQGKAVMFSAITETPERKQYLNYTNEAIFSYSAVVVGSFDDRQVYIDLGEDAQNKSIGFVKGSGLAQYIKAQYPGLDYVEVESTHLGFDYVESGKIDLFAINDITARYFIEKKGYEDLRVALKLNYQYDLKIAMHKSSMSYEMISVLDRALKEIRPRAREQIFNNWNNIKKEPKTNWDIVLVVVIVVLVVLLFFVWKTLDLTLIISQKNRELEEHEDFYQKLINTTGTGYVVFDDLGNVVSANNEYVKLSGHHSLNEIIGRKASAWVAAYDREKFTESLFGCFENGTIKDLDVDCIMPDGSMLPVEINASVITHNGKDQVMALCRNISKRKKNEKQLEHLAKSDDLTGLCNRRELMLGIKKEFQRAQRYGKDLTVMLFDLDHFKKINDDYGHQAGDYVLKEMATEVKQSLRISDFIGRYGGEEFVVVMPETSIDEGVFLANRLCKLVAAKKITVRGGLALSITFSAGVASYPSHAGDWEELIKVADDAMYEAKAQGRNQVQVVHSGLSVQQQQLGLTLD